MNRWRLRPLPIQTVDFVRFTTGRYRGARRVSRDRLVRFKGREYAVPFGQVGREVPVFAAGKLLIEHLRGRGPRITGILPPLQESAGCR
jgi:hypothetical protein